MAWTPRLVGAALAGTVVLMAACGGDSNSTQAAERETATAPAGTFTVPPGHIVEGVAPRVIGLRLAEAVRRLKSAFRPFVWFRVQDSRRAPSDLIVCYQSPAPGEWVTDQMRLALTTRCPLRVPKVDGQPLRVAEPKLKDLKIVVGDYLDARDDDFPASIEPKRSWILCFIDVEGYARSVVQETTGDLYGHGETLQPNMFVAPTLAACSESNEPEDG